VSFSSKVAHLPIVEAWEVAGGKLLWQPGGSLLRRWSMSTVELLLLLLLVLLLELPWMEMWSTTPILLLLWLMQLTLGGVYTMRYLGGAPLELPLPADPGIIFFHFFLSTLATAYIILS
jgi:hypothetical protein